jgi:hypothetical protein
VSKCTFYSVALLASSLACRAADGGSSGATVPTSILDPAKDGTNTTVESSNADGSATAPTPPPKLPRLSIEQTCVKFAALAAEGCFWAKRLGPQMAEKEICEQSLANWLDPSNPTNASLAANVDCWRLDCEAAANCIVASQRNAPAPPPRACGERIAAPIFVDDETWANRRGAKTKRFADIKTTTAEPVEVCGIEGEIEWMSQVRCNDGSSPYRSAMEINESRDPGMTRGGRCDSILDSYTVKCPETTYQVYIDRYVCLRKY